MSLKLILMRHAKSDWDDPRLPDHKRPLNGRGRRSAVALGEWLRAKEHVPDQVLCSSAARTRETLALLELKTQASYRETLYLAEPEVMLREFRGATGRCVLMIAHNPGCAEFAERILRQPVSHGRFWDYPTGATLVADVTEDHWANVGFATAEAMDFVVPRELV